MGKLFSGQAQTEAPGAGFTFPGAPRRTDAGVLSQGGILDQEPSVLTPSNGILDQLTKLVEQGQDVPVSSEASLGSGQQRLPTKNTLDLLTDLAVQRQGTAVEPPSAPKKRGGLFANFFPEGASTIEKISLLQPLLPRVAVGPQSFTERFISQPGPDLSRTIRNVTKSAGERTQKREEREQTKQREAFLRSPEGVETLESLPPLLQLGLKTGVVPLDQATNFLASQERRTEDVAFRQEGRDFERERFEANRALSREKFETGKSFDQVRIDLQRNAQDLAAEERADVRGLRRQELDLKRTALHLQTEKFLNPQLNLGSFRESKAKELFNKRTSQLTPDELGVVNEAWANHDIEQSRQNQALANQARITGGLAQDFTRINGLIKVVNNAAQIFQATENPSDIVGLTPHLRQRFQNRFDSIFGTEFTDPQQAAFESMIFTVTNDYLNLLSGAAISPAELERLKQQLPFPTDSSTVFVAKMTNVADLLHNRALDLSKFATAPAGELGNLIEKPISLESAPAGIANIGEITTDRPPGFSAGDAPQIPQTPTRPLPNIESMSDADFKAFTNALSREDLDVMTDGQLERLQKRVQKRKTRR